jgi:hypothetical protein
VRPHSTVAVHPDAADGWVSRLDRPNLYTEEEAARRTSRTRRTIRQWRADGRLTPVEDSLMICGQYLYDGPALTAAEESARHGRVRTAGR